MSSLKNLKFLAALFLFAFLIISCSKENIDDNTVKPGGINPTTHEGQNSLLSRSVTSDEGLDMDCFTVLFPFTLIDNEGNTHDINSEDDFFIVFDSTNTYFIVDFVYPISIKDESGNISQIADGEALTEAFANCLPNGWTEDQFPAYPINLNNSCVTLVYPITVVNGQGTEQTISNESALEDALAIEELYFVFPISLVDTGDSTTVVSNVEELLTVIFSCNGIDGGVDTSWVNGNFDYFGCYELVYPFNVVLADGSVVTVENHMEYCDLLLTGSVVDFSYPLSLVDANGTTITVDSSDELNNLLDDCVNVVNYDSDLFILLAGTNPFDSLGINSCYNINFPITVNVSDANGQNTGTYELISIDGIINLISTNQGPLFNLQYPITVVKNDNGEVVVLNSSADLLDLLASCQ